MFDPRMMFQLPQAPPHPQQGGMASQAMGQMMSHAPQGMMGPSPQGGGMAQQRMAQMAPQAAQGMMQQAPAPQAAPQGQAASAMQNLGSSLAQRATGVAAPAAPPQGQAASAMQNLGASLAQQATGAAPPAAPPQGQAGNFLQSLGQRAGMLFSDETLKKDVDRMNVERQMRRFLDSIGTTEKPSSKPSYDTDSVAGRALQRG